MCLKSPISWKKAALGDSLIWCGWKFNFRSETVSLEPDKLLKLAQQIQALLAAKKVTKKALQSCLGLLNWATSISLNLRSYTAPLYSDLHSPPGTLHNIPPRMWQRFLFSLDSKAVVTKPLPGLHISTSARIIEVGSIKVRRTDPRVADPSASEISLTKDSLAFKPHQPSPWQTHTSSTAFQQQMPWQQVTQLVSGVGSAPKMASTGSQKSGPCRRSEPFGHSFTRKPSDT